MVEYTYDAWGNHVAYALNATLGKMVKCDNKTAEEKPDALYLELSQINPFRYRGYYFDTETKLYYLKSRYYDPEVGRFITIDDLSYIDPNTINGLNLYAYCGNNPVMRSDPDGTMPKWVEKMLGWFAVAALAIAAVVMIAVVAVGTVASGGLLGAVLVGAGVGILAGIGGGIVAQGGLANIANMNPWSVAASGAIVGAIGAVSGATSFAFSQIGQTLGQALGHTLSNARHLSTGLKIAKVLGISTSSLIKAGSFIGAMAGGALGGVLTNNIANRFVSDALGEEYKVDNPNYMRSALLKFFQWLNPIK